MVAEARVNQWLSGFALDEFLHAHVAAVILRLPSAVREDLVSDPAFRLADYEPGPGVVMHVPLGIPRARKPVRSVVLKRTLRHRPIAFVRWVIAHELAHAHLRNGGRHPGEDPEHAADSLAAAWGFPRPAHTAWSNR